LARPFPLGRTYITATAHRALSAPDVLLALRRHARGDWGELPPEDWQANELALVEGSRLFSTYRDERGIWFWIITEADRSATTVLLPEDY
jgi:hypothetical protein